MVRRRIKVCWTVVLTEMERQGGRRGLGGADRDVQGPSVSQLHKMTLWLWSQVRHYSLQSQNLSLLVVCRRSPFIFSSHPEEEEQGQAQLISYLITLVMLHIIGKRWAKWTNKLSDMGLPSLGPVQSQGHLGNSRDTDAMTERDTERGRGPRRERGISDGKRVGNVKYFLLSTSWPGTCIDFCMWKISVFDKVG